MKFNFIFNLIKANELNLIFSVFKSREKCMTYHIKVHIVHYKYIIHGLRHRYLKKNIWFQYKNVSRF